MITLHIPQGANINLNKEISSAQKIKDKSVRQNTISGLNKIKQYL
jgi:peptide subunit release factor 1 (eRF1)